ncbi:MAG: hypothetical protein IPN14_05825 [Bacteroidetes bacterium]|nr:hypothetical protein [Bacteroidota bacterium]
MRKSIILMSGFILAASISNAQLYSSGNNVIAGTNVGIGNSSPSTKLHIKTVTTGELLRMENTNPLGFGKFTLFNDEAANYATFTKYGSTVAGGYPGIVSQYPYANMLAFGNNGGVALFTASGNVGIAIAKAGTTKLKFNVDYNTENLGIGGSNIPRTNVHINSAVSGDTLKITNSTTGHTATDGLDIRTTGLTAAIFNRENSSLDFGTNNISRVKILADGKVSIGSVSTPAGYKLYVEEGILAEKVKVAVKTTGEWSDYVFAKDYKLLQLPEVEAYISTHSHLPGVPSAQDVVDNGIDMAKMDAKLLEKVEELTIHLIEMNKKMMEMKSNMTEMKNKIEELEKQ